ncbi:PRADC1 isoform X1 [Brachionus plicatilis]|uniref:PRADC1 isoform X1 n=1 Tax=Brachionus plicatilis TaxID=10195 RepID=A0A3M7SW25_BRAPC|nr:PRADC1 isoform X1 [Brachionus plicatilis]
MITSHLSLLLTFILVLGANAIQYISTPFPKTNKDGSISIVTQEGKLDTSELDFEELFFEVIHPKEISYTFRIKLAKGFGSSFQKPLENVKLIPTEPYNACGSILNGDKIRGNVAFVVRGDCSFTTKAVNSENVGAAALIITDNDPLNEMMIDMVGDDTQRVVNIPSVYLPWKDGYMIKKTIDKAHSGFALLGPNGEC